MAKAWLKTPSEWDALDDTDKAQMMAFEEESATMAAYEEQLHEDEMDRQRMRNK